MITHVLIIKPCLHVIIWRNTINNTVSSFIPLHNTDMNRSRPRPRSKCGRKTHSCVCYLSVSWTNTQQNTHQRCQSPANMQTVVLNDNHSDGQAWRTAVNVTHLDEEQTLRLSMSRIIVSRFVSSQSFCCCFFLFKPVNENPSRTFHCAEEDRFSSKPGVIRLQPPGALTTVGLYRWTAPLEVDRCSRYTAAHIII